MRAFLKRLESLESAAAPPKAAPRVIRLIYLAKDGKLVPSEPITASAGELTIYREAAESVEAFEARFLGTHGTDHWCRFRIAGSLISRRAGIAGAT